MGEGSGLSPSLKGDRTGGWGSAIGVRTCCSHRLTSCGCHVAGWPCTLAAPKKCDHLNIVTSHLIFMIFHNISWYLIVFQSAFIILSSIILYAFVPRVYPFWAIAWFYASDRVGQKQNILGVCTRLNIFILYVRIDGGQNLSFEIVSRNGTIRHQMHFGEMDLDHFPACVELWKMRSGIYGNKKEESETIIRARNQDTYVGRFLGVSRDQIIWNSSPFDSHDFPARTLQNPALPTKKQNRTNLLGVGAGWNGVGIGRRQTGTQQNSRSINSNLRCLWQQYDHPFCAKRHAVWHERATITMILYVFLEAHRNPKESIVGIDRKL